MWIPFVRAGQKSRQSFLEAELYRLAGDMAGRPVDRLIPCRSGRNSRVYKVSCGREFFALKSYPSIASDPRDRFGTEIKALKFYEENGNPYTPRLLAVDISRGVALMEWVEGYPVKEPGAFDIDQAVEFIALTHAAEARGGEVFGLASETCLCGADLDRHVAARLEKFSAILQQEPELSKFLECELLPVLERVRGLVHGNAFFTPLPRDKRSLIPADLGFHNAIKTPGGKIYFIDFEYFGWDDPVRLAADFMLHPGMILQEEIRDHFCRGMIEIFQVEDREFEQRLLQLLPLYAIRWALILLNEFLPERWQARVFAGETTAWEEIKAMQLEKAREVLGRAVACLVPS